MLNWNPGDTQGTQSPPTLEYILDLAEDSTAYFRPFHKACLREEEYYYLKRPVPVPEGMAADPVNPATPRAIINIATDHVDVNNISIDVPTMERSKARGERLKKFYQGCWLSVKTPVLRTAVKHSFLYGVGWMKAHFLPELWYDAPKLSKYGETDSEGVFTLLHPQEWKQALSDFMEKRKLLFPLSVENVNPKELMWDDSKTGPKWIIRTVQGNAGDIRRKYAGWQSTKNGVEMVQWREYWDDTWYAYIADNEFVKPPTRHGYGRFPFSPIIPANSVDFDAGKPEVRYQGILNPVHSLLDAEARIITQITAILRSVAWRTLDFQGPLAQAEDTAGRYEIFGGKNAIPPSVTVAASPLINLPPDLIRQLDMVQTMIEEATFPNVVRGMRPKGVSTGFAVATLAGMGRLVFQGTADGVSRAIEGVNSTWASMVENLGLTITVHARSEVHNFDQTIRSTDVKGYLENKVTLKAEAPEEREREALLARQLYSQGLISLYEAQRRVGIVNPLEEQNQMAAEKMLEGLRTEQIEELRSRLAGSLGKQREQQAGPPNEGNRFIAGMPQLQRPGERNIQAARVASQQGQPSVFPRGLGGFDTLAKQLTGSGGGPVRTPGQIVERR